MSTIHSLEDLKHYHGEAAHFFAAELMMLKEAVPLISNERLGKAAILLLSCGQTGAAILQLANQPNTFSTETMMLARSFMEKVTNFCYVGVCDEKEYRAFILHPVYKHYHNVRSLSIEDDLDFIKENEMLRIEKQQELKKIAIVQEALAIFSETNERLNWTKKTLGQRISVLEKWGKSMDVFFTINKIQYYSDASEALHGSLYGCTFDLAMFDEGFGQNVGEVLDKKLYKDSACVLLHLGILIHESCTLISYSNEIKEIYEGSYQNRSRALSLLHHILGKQIHP